MHPDRVVIGADPGDEEAARRRSPRSTSRWAASMVRTDVTSAEMIKLASNAFLADQDLLHQRDRQRLRGGRRRRRRGRPGDGPRRAHRALLPARRDRLWGQLLPEGRQRPEDAGRQHRLPLPAPQRGDRGQRAAEAARRRQAAEAPRVACRQARSRCSASPSSPTPTTCARPRAWCSRPAWRARGRRSSPTTRSPGRAAEELLGTVELSDIGARGARRAPTPRSWSPSGPSSPSSTGRRRPKRWPGRCSSTAATSSTPRRCAAAGFAYEGIGRDVEAAPSDDRRGVGRCRRSSWSAARGRDCGR